MKLRRNQSISPKNFFICSLDNPRSPRRLVRFPPFPEILHRDVGKPTPYNASALTVFCWGVGLFGNIVYLCIV